MRFGVPTFATALALAALTLSSCAKRNELPVNSSLSEDDDTFCRAGGKVAAGSPEYVACRKDRDVQRNNAQGRADRRQRDLGEWMLNHPDHP